MVVVGVGVRVDVVVGGWVKKMGIYQEDFFSSDVVIKVVDIVKDIGDKVVVVMKEVEKKFDVYLVQLEEEVRRVEMEEVRRNEEWLLVVEESWKRNMELVGYGGVEEKNLFKGKKYDYQQFFKKDDQYEEIFQDVDGFGEGLFESSCLSLELFVCFLIILLFGLQEFDFIIMG